jgi:hypothetical protein
LCALMLQVVTGLCSPLVAEHACVVHSASGYQLCILSTVLPVVLLLYHEYVPVVLCVLQSSHSVLVSSGSTAHSSTCRHSFLCCCCHCFLLQHSLYVLVSSGSTARSLSTWLPVLLLSACAVLSVTSCTFLLQNSHNVLVSSGSTAQYGLVAKIADLGLSRVIKQHATHRTTRTVSTCIPLLQKVLHLLICF